MCWCKLHAHCDRQTSIETFEEPTQVQQSVKVEEPEVPIEVPVATLKEEGISAESAKPPASTTEEVPGKNCTARN